jgi:MFS transporter, FHS family, L-fucose permease
MPKSVLYTDTGANIVTILFFLWGFAYGLLDGKWHKTLSFNVTKFRSGLEKQTDRMLMAVLNSHFQSSLHLSNSQAAGLSSAYFGAYFICPPPLLSRDGFSAELDSE